VSYFTLRIIIILMETIKDLYKRLLDHHPAPLAAGAGGYAPDPVKEKEKQNQRDKPFPLSFLPISRVS
jgi:hypothetical protein